MDIVKEHYETHLADFYAWMTGNYQEQVDGQKSTFAKFDIIGAVGKTAIDLGCGHGIQSVALASLGYRVKAIDFSAKMLRELKTHLGDLTVEMIQDDLLSFLAGFKHKVDLIVCMGDSLTHLQHKEDVESLIALASDRLIGNGQILISFRDLSIPRSKEDRFIPIRSDDQRILTCFLEYHDQHVMVYDILQEKINNVWVQKISSYPKLRISASEVVKLLKSSNFHSVRTEVKNGMTFVCGSRS